MKLEEYESIKNRDYSGTIKYLENKYWDKEKADYMTKDFILTGKGSRGKEGLEQHHIKENVVANLSNPDIAKEYSFDFQKAENLVYCDKLEHMLLHLLIFEETYTGSTMLGIGGIVERMLPDLFIGYSAKVVTDARLIHIKDNKDTFVQLLQRFVDDVAKFDPEYDLVSKLVNIRNYTYSKIKEEIVTPDIFEEALPELFDDSETSLLFDYNISTYKKAEMLLDTEGACCILMGTGIGKTTTALEYLRTHKCRGLILCPSNTIKAAWLENKNCDVMTYAQFMNCYKKVNYSKYGCVICDEAHHANEDAKRWVEGVKYIIDNRILPILGLTATKGNCGKIFGENNIVKGYDIFQAIQEKILYPVSYVTSLYSATDEDNELLRLKTKFEALKENRLKSSDTSEELLGQIDWTLQEMSNLVTLVNKSLKQLKKSPKKIITFCQSADDFKYVSNLMNKIFPKLPVYTMSYKDRAGAIKAREAFRSCKKGILLAVNMVSEGAHYENVDTLFLFRRTDSDIVYQQQIGRIMTKTTKANPHAVIFDFVNNAQHVTSLLSKLINAYVDSLSEKAKKKAAKQISNNGETLKSDQIIIDSKIQSLLNLFDKCQKQIEYDNRPYWQDEFDALTKEEKRTKIAWYIPKSISKQMIEDVDIKNKNILIIGNPESSVVDEMINQNSKVTLITSFENTVKEIVYNNVKMIVAPKTQDGILKEVKKLKEKFDLVFANPPFSVGNKIIDEAMKVANDAIVLMPLSKYKGNNLHQKVKNIKIVDSSEFKDAEIGTSLCISCLNSNFNNGKTWDEFAIDSYDSKYRTFYELNNKKPRGYKEYISDDYNCNVFKDDIKDMDWSKMFMLTLRTAENGVHKTKKCHDYNFNTNKIFDADKIACTFLIFNSEVEVNNFYRFWYKNPLMNMFIKGLNKSSGKVHAAIPRIDWSKDRDYEHLAYEELCNILKNED